LPEKRRFDIQTTKSSFDSLLSIEVFARGAVVSSLKITFEGEKKVLDSGT
jgi:hypothetical protein